MKRLIEQELLKCKNNPDKMPLVMFGARQVGKTHTIFNFGKQHFDNVLVFNFEGNKNLHEIFELDIDDSHRIIRDLEKLSLKTITKNTLIFFDEIQECAKALSSLKYFSEKAQNEFNIIAAGSLLGVAVNRENYSFPVGKVNRLVMYPMNFAEFLLAKEQEELLKVIKESFDKDTALPQSIHAKALDLYEMYLVVGGMPKAVLEYIQKQDFDFVRIKQQEIMSDYHNDMIKYASKTEAIKIRDVYRSIPSQLAKENKRFQYNLINSHARAVSYEIGLSWLIEAGLVCRCNKVTRGEIPLKYYEDFLSYKVYSNDVGLLNCQSGIPVGRILTGDFGGGAKGAMSENYVANQLVSNGFELNYWESSNTAELDFVVQIGDDVVPIETKSNLSTKSKSLNIFREKYNIEKSIRVSAKNFGFVSGIKSVPLYAVWCIKC